MKKLALLLLACACASPEPEGLRLADPGTGAAVRFDLYARPLPDIPFPNDIATRYDPLSPTKRRVNASMQASTEWEKATRTEFDNLDGWGTYAPITVAFDKPLDVNVIYDHMQGDDYDFMDDAVYVIDISRDSPDFCQAVPLDMGEGNFPLTLENQGYVARFTPNDPRNDTQQLVFEEKEEDANGNGKLDPGEDTDMDGVLDHPNFRHPDDDPFSAMSFYERETNTLIMKPVLPMREQTRYAVVITKRLLDVDGRPVRSPFKYVNHAAQTNDLLPLHDCLGHYGISLDDVAFTWSFTTQSETKSFVAIRDGLYGLGPMAYLSQQFPAKLTKLWDLRDKSAGGNPRVVPNDVFLDAAKTLIAGSGTPSPKDQVALDNAKFIDFHVIGSFESPQFFPRNDDAGNPLPLYKQTWKVDPVSGAAFVRPETITFWVTVPKNRGGKPAPVLILGHGYTGNKLDPLFYGGFFARYGIATIGVECVSHGVDLSKDDWQLAQALFAGKGLAPMFSALVPPPPSIIDTVPAALKGSPSRALDWDHDGTYDSGADFWTSYVFHTRDVVRQSAVDYMRLIQILKTFDGRTTWEYDANGDGKPDLAGDFDGDGVVDVGGTAPVDMTGGSLGGIMSVIMGGLEPQLDVAVPVSGGAGLGDIGVRSIQGGVGEAVNLRMFGPGLVAKRARGTSTKSCVATTQCAASEICVDRGCQPLGGGLELWQYLPNLNGLGAVDLGPITADPKEGDTVVVTNQHTHEYRCGRVQRGGQWWVAVSSDEGDALKLDLYSGPLPPKTPEGCDLSGATAYATIDTVGAEVCPAGGGCPSSFQDKTLHVGDPLVALGDGFGLRRSSPEARRFMGLAQTALDSGDPAAYAPYFEKWHLQYGTGEQVSTRAMVFSTIGDMNVPMATGAAIGRAAGFIELFKKDPRYGKTDNRVLIDTGALEACERTGRYTNSKGQPVLMDLEFLSSITGVDDGFDVPRLNPPFRIFKPSERVGGVTGSIFPMVKPTGKHGFDTPDPTLAWDLGSLIINAVGHYVQTDGKEFRLDACQVTSSCPWTPPIPP